MAPADARQAYFDGEFERCLALCDAVRAKNDVTQFEIALLRARVHIRMDRGDRALDALRAVSFTALSTDYYVTAQMLSGAAYVRLGQKQRGEAVLLEAMERAGEAHSTVRAELALELGIVKFRLGEFDEAERLCASVPANADVIYAHALEYRGWIAQARGQSEPAAARFREALAALASCRRRDRFVEVKSLYGLTALCPELLLCDDWPAVQARLRKLDWSAGGLARWRFWISIAASMMCETTGDTAGARNWARNAEQAADGDGYRAVAFCRLAAVFRGMRERHSHLDFVERAAEIYDSLDVRDLGADLQQLPLFLAEELAYTARSADAERLIAQYRESILPALKSSSGDVERYVALERTLEAVLCEARGDSAQAVRTYSKAYRVLAKLGYRRRATAVALRLGRLTGQKRYLDYAEDALRETSPQFWMSRDLHELRNGSGPAVTVTELAILRLLVDGKTYKEIAAARHTSVKTVGNHVQSMFRKFAVNSRGELTVAALRHGVVSLHHGQSA